jgi:glycosyltransferase involved in cell wall biosynthesis
VRIVVDRVPSFRLTVVGDGPLRDELHALRDRLRLQGSVEFLGERTDVHTLLSDADIFVLSSLKEGLALTLLEAMATGLAVVATDVGGNREVVNPRKDRTSRPEPIPRVPGRGGTGVGRSP